MHDIKDLIDRIDRKFTEENHIVDLRNNEKICFRDVSNFLYDIMNGKINDFNKEKKYEKRFRNIEKKLANRTESSEFTKLYEQVITALKNILFCNKKSSGRGLTISSLPILLSKMYNNSSKKLISDIDQLINNLYDNKQITKQVYNVLNKAITYK